MSGEINTLPVAADASLLSFNTFGLPARAELFAEFTSVEELRAVLAHTQGPRMILGGGSNIVFISDVVPGLVLRNAIGGIAVTYENSDFALVTAGGGVNWHELVLYVVGQGLGGLENLSLIPGTVGAAPVQNIGAYGVEIKDTLVHLEAVELATGEMHQMTNAQCRFGYRDSFFKGEGKGKYCITTVTFRLTRTHHRLNISYGDIKRTLETMGVGEPTIEDVSQAIIAIRSSKLPDPAHIGNCGSFFKNPEVEHNVFDRILAEYPEIIHFELPNGLVKIPAGWLIEQCGWKGKHLGRVGCYEKQALVLVNLGGATGQEVAAMSQAIMKSVQEKFGIELEQEVNMI